MDSNGDGVGDLRGIVQKLPFIVHMGYDAIWLSPVYPSPMADFGYDVSDYTGIHSEYGSMEDFDALVQECQRLGLKIILDFVPNHCSSEHQWFKSAIASRNSQYRDWFIWRDPAPDGGPPNNWLGAFGGPAWTMDESSGQYYMHSFLPEQPDLNWFNPDVQNAMFDALRFWMSKGVDGFRVDVILRLVKDRLFRDEPQNPGWTEGMDPYSRLQHIYTRNAEGVHEFVRMFRKVVDEKPGTVLIGETYLPIPELITYYGNNDGCHLPFNFGLMTTAFSPAAFSMYINQYLSALPAFACPNWVLDNHDQPRITAQDRFGPEGAAAAIMLLYVLPGTITAYYGDELPMSDPVIPPDRIRDPKVLREGGGTKSRDASRTPMQWDDTEFAGFSKTEPWLPVSEDYRQNNVAAAQSNPESILNLTWRLMEFRKKFQEIIGKYPIASVDDQDVLHLHRNGKGVSLHVALNFSSRTITVPLDVHADSELLLSTQPASSVATFSETYYTLRPYEGIVFKK